MVNNRTFIIAEAGVNHNGDIDIAKELIDVAAETGVDAIKFQTFRTEELVTKNAPKADYQKKTTGDGNQYEMLKKLELSYEEHLILKKYCEDIGIIFLSTPFDFKSVDLLKEINMPIYKISSGDITNIPLIKYIAKINKPIILSTGMSNLGEVEEAVGAIKQYSNNDIHILHCTSNYPTAYEDVNLNSMITLKNAFKLPVGYSDHTEGVEIPIAAVAMGATIIEKHITLDKKMEGPDHKVSLEPIELKKMVDSIRNIEKAFGDGIKRCSKNEEHSKIVGRKSIVARVNISKNEVITYDMLNIKRPGNGVEPKYIDNFNGKIALEDIQKDTLIKWSQVR